MTQQTDPMHYCQGDYGDQPLTHFGSYDGWMEAGCTSNPRDPGDTTLRCASCSADPDSQVCLSQ
jgi:hypothetical protein